MKRNKIKKKYLDLILKKEDKHLEEYNIFDTIERSILKSFITIGLILLLLLWGLIPVILLGILGIDYTEMENLPKVLIAFFTDLGLILLFIKIYYQTLKEDFKNFFNGDIWKQLKVAFRYWGIGMLVMIFSNHIISIITNGQLAENEESVRSLIDVYPWYMAFQLIIYAPITEELIFRKSIRDITKNPYIYVLISGLVFGGMHVLSSLSSLVDLLYLIPYCALGFAFAALYNKTNNIYSSMIVHAFHNGLALVLYLMTVIS